VIKWVNYVSQKLFNMNPQRFSLALIFVTIGFLTELKAQKKALDHTAYDTWHFIKNQSISNDGKWITYALGKNSISNPIVKLSDFEGTEVLSYARGLDPKFSFDGAYLFFNIKADVDDVNQLKRIKTKKEHLPLDTLGIYDVNAGVLSKVPHLTSYEIPEKWSDWLIYQHNVPQDTSRKKVKKSSKEAGYELIIQNLIDPTHFKFPFVNEYTLSKKGGKVAFTSHGDTAGFQSGVYIFDTQTQSVQSIYASKGIFKSLKWDEAGQHLSFISDLDTTKALKRYFNLHLWSTGSDRAETLLTARDAFLENHYLVSEHAPLEFSKNGSLLYFGKSLPILQADTSLLEHEIVKVEVWTYMDQRLYPQQKIEKEKDQKASFLSVYDLTSKEFLTLGTENIPHVYKSDEGNGAHLIGYNEKPYLKSISWEGSPGPVDIYALRMRTGTSEKIAEKIHTRPKMSPLGNYAYWYDAADSAWYTYSFLKDGINKITNNTAVDFFNEEHDTPNLPRAYGLMSWSQNDEKMLIYDRYDIWQVDPEGILKPIRITPEGRLHQQKYRYIQLKKEERSIQKNQTLLLHSFNEINKMEGIHTLKYSPGSGLKTLTTGPYQYRSIRQAQEGKELIFTQENFSTFPDIKSTRTFRKIKPISQANPQQDTYQWGTAELYQWTSLDGHPLEGLLIKPDNFDPTKKYPMIVNFYEQSSDNLYRHHAPNPGRSTINYSFYASRGYLIFNPNIHYRTGYPGESAYNSVIPGVTSLIDQGFVDPDHVGIQGHSWGGYQIAHIVTKTDLFKCAEAGAPIPNMISAYGGIRWWTGLSRMFQYERTQSRIGGSLWKYPLRYIENSPIFFVDKINTPILIMHNDADGHVPWYQGIEFFVALRRLNKPTWLLNYQGEPHWPLKLENRIDFNIRMAQYFDYYLKEAPMPSWMLKGIPATELGIRDHLELMDQ
jgi:dienelactone hydrolase|tara:strand:- start:5183 stop:8008 length:2826 start_codon:yes stop_codon:yes gene_type:complete